MDEAQFGLVAFLGDLKDDIGAVPLGFVLDEIDSGVS